MEECVDIQELEGNKNRAAIIRKTSKEEELNLTYGYIRFGIKDIKNMNVTQVQYTTENQWETTKDNT